MPQQIIPFSSRIRGSGTLALVGGSLTSYGGQEGRQDRRQIIVTNLDATLDLKVRTANGQVFGTVFARTALTWETNAEVQVFNPNGSPVNYEVCEIFYDAGTPNNNAFAAAPGQAAAGGGAVAGGGWANPSGGGWSGTSSFVTGSGRTQEN